MIKSREIDDIIKGMRGFLPFAVINSDPRNRIEKLLSYSANDVIPNSLSLMNVDGTARFTKLGVGVDPISALTIDFDPALENGLMLRDNRDTDRRSLINQAGGATYFYNTDNGVIGTEAIRILSNNNTYFSANVGIGTDTPSTSMTGGIHIKSTAGNSLILEKTSGAAMQFRSDATTIRASIAGINGADGLVFQTGAAQNERMRITSSGNVGIGTSNPVTNFVVSDSSSSTGFEINPDDANNKVDLFAYDRGDTVYRDIQIDADTVYFRTISGAATPVERMRITNDGNVGIGISPSFALDVDGSINISAGNTLKIDGVDAVFSNWSTNGSDIYRNSKVGIGSTIRGNVFYGGVHTGVLQLEGTDFGSTILSQIVNSTTNYPSHVLARSRGTSVNSNVIVADNDILGEITGQGNDGTDFIQSAGIQFNVDGSPATDVMPGRITFHTNSGGTSTSERMRITSAGLVGINTTNPPHALAAHLPVGNGSSVVASFKSNSNPAQISFQGLGTTDNVSARFGVHSDDNFALYQDDAYTFWFGENYRMGIGTNSPDYRIHSVGAAGVESALVLEETTSGVSRQARLQQNSGATVLAADGTSNSLIFETVGVEAARFTSAGLFEVTKSGSAEGLAKFESNDDVNVKLKSTFAASNGAQIYLQYEDAFNSATNSFKAGIPGSSTNYSIGYGANDSFSNANSLLTITSAGLVGIGTDSPNDTLHVKLGTNLNWQFGYPSNSVTTLAALNDAESAYVTARIDAGTLELNGQSGGDVNLGAGVLVVDTSNGRVGIGTDAPSYKTEIAAGASTEGLAVTASSGDVYLQTDGQLHGYQKLDVATAGLQIKGFSDGGGTKTEQARIYLTQTATSAAGGEVRFYTNNGSSVGERVRIYKDGDVRFIGVSGNMYWDQSTVRLGIGTDSPAKTLSVVGDAVFDGPTQSGITSGASRSGAILNLDGNYVWEAGYAGGDYNGQILFNTSDTSGNAAGVGAAIRSMALDPYGRYSLDFHTTGNNATEGDDALRMRINHLGNVGIGTDAPTHKLSVTDTSGIVVRFNGINGYNYDIESQDNGQLWDHEIGSSTPKFSWSSSTAELMRLDSTGLGIGTTSPTAPLEVYASATTGQNAAIVIDGPSGNNYEGIQYRIDGVDIGYTAQESTGRMYHGAALEHIFRTGTGAGSIVGGTDRMRIDSSGNVGIGVGSSDTIGEELVVNGSMLVYGAGGAAGSGNGTLWIGTTSNGRQFGIRTDAANRDLFIDRYSGGWFEAVRVDVGTGLLEAKSSLNVIGTTYSSDRIQSAAGFGGHNAGRRIMLPGGGEYNTTASSVTGAIKVRLPTSWDNHMQRIVIKVYEYSTGESFEVVCGGYDYASSKLWYNTFAYIIGQPNVDRNFTVRFGHDGTGSAVYIGELTSTWSYPQVFVTEYQAGYQNSPSTVLYSGWNVSFITSWPTYSSGNTTNGVSTTLTNCSIYKHLQAIADGGTGATTAADARTNLGLGSLATASTISNSNWSGTDLAIANGGTGASDAGTARSNLGLGSLATASTISNSNWSGTDLAVANGGTGASNASGARTNLGLGTISTQNSNSVSITGGTISGLTSLGVIQTTPAYELDVTGSIRATGDVISDSDVRYKTNIHTIDNALEKVNNMRGVYFTKNEEDHVGVIAQEIEEILPEVVRTASDEEGTKSVSYGNIVGVLIEAIKEQQQQINELKEMLEK